MTIANLSRLLQLPNAGDFVFKLTDFYCNAKFAVEKLLRSLNLILKQIG